MPAPHERVVTTLQQLGGFQWMQAFFLGRGAWEAPYFPNQQFTTLEGQDLSPVNPGAPSHSGSQSCAPHMFSVEPHWTTVFKLNLDARPRTPGHPYA